MLCDNETAPDARFCDGCGASLSRACPTCHAAARANAWFCSQCGTALDGAAPQVPGPPAAAPVFGQRKHVTILFADVRGSTELIRALDPEEALARIDPAVQAAAAAVARFGGIVNEVQGGGLMALFGAPIAAEDHPVCACLAARAILQGLPPGIEMRVGVHSGEVVVRSSGRDASDYSAIGPAVYFATRLEQSAAFLRARADRFSPYFDDPAGFGVTLEPLPAYRHIYGGDAAAQSRLGYHFAMRSPELDDIASYTGDTAREYADWREHQAASALWLEGDVVHDRRWGWPVADAALAPAAAALLRMAWRIVPWVRVLRELGGQHPDLDQAAAGLERRGWLLREAGQVLALPLRQPGFRAAPSIAQVREAIGRPLAAAAE